MKEPVHPGLLAVTTWLHLYAALVWLYIALLPHTDRSKKYFDSRNWFVDVIYR